MEGISQVFEVIIPLYLQKFCSLGIWSQQPFILKRITEYQLISIFNRNTVKIAITTILELNINFSDVLYNRNPIFTFKLCDNRSLTAFQSAIYLNSLFTLALRRVGMNLAFD